MISAETFSNLLDERFRRRPARRSVQRLARLLGRFSLALPEHRATQAVMAATLAPLGAWFIRMNRWAFDFVRPDDDAYWTRLTRHWRRQGLLADREDLDPFERAVYAWCGIEGSAMAQPEHWRIISFEPDRCIERLYAQDEEGRSTPGCPWGLGGEDQGFACRTLMMATHNLFRALGAAEMRIDVTMCELTAIERRVVGYLGGRQDPDPAAVWSALLPEIEGVLRRSQPVEPDVFVDGALCPEIVSVLQEQIGMLVRGETPARFCQFRLLRRNDGSR